MKIFCLSRDAEDLERRRGPASISMCLRLLLAAFAMFTSIPRGHAFDCFASAEAVRQANHNAWPSWTLRAPGHEGSKCWYASTRGAAHDHPNPPVHRNPVIPRTEGVGAKEESEQEVEVTSSLAPADGVRAPSAGSGSSFDDRFSAILDGSPPGAESKLQKIIDLFSGGAHDP
ncbi:MAG TPA: hypothetical protein VGM73_07605 [Candidatus Didemnitutus sp.]